VELVSRDMALHSAALSQKTAIFIAMGRFFPFPTTTWRQFFCHNVAIHWREKLWMSTRWEASPSVRPTPLLKANPARVRLSHRAKAAISITCTICVGIVRGHRDTLAVRSASH
jgi:hypothetical protein